MVTNLLLFLDIDFDSSDSVSRNKEHLIASYKKTIFDNSKDFPKYLKRKVFEYVLAIEDGCCLLTTFSLFVKVKEINFVTYDWWRIFCKETKLPEDLQLKFEDETVYDAYTYLCKCFYEYVVENYGPTIAKRNLFCYDSTGEQIKF